MARKNLSKKASAGRFADNRLLAGEAGPTVKLGKSCVRRIGWQGVMYAGSWSRMPTARPADEMLIGGKAVLKQGAEMLPRGRAVTLLQTISVVAAAL